MAKRVLAKSVEQVIVRLWKEMFPRKNPDNVAYTAKFERFHARVVAETRLALTLNEVWKAVLRLRKQSRIP